MTDNELRELAASLFSSLKETNDSIKAVNVRLAYTEDEARADRARTQRLEEALTVLTELSRNMDARLDAANAQRIVSERRIEASERRMEASERRLELLEVRQDKADGRQDKLDEALASLARTVERYINARNTNGDKPK